MNKTKISEAVEQIVNWLRFVRDKSRPAFKADIERATGVQLTPALIRHGDQTGLFRYSQTHGSFI